MIFQASLSVSLQSFLSLSFQVSHLLTSRLDSPMFSDPEKRPVLWNPGSKDSVSHVFNFIQLFHQIIYIYWIWHTFLSPEIYFWWYCSQIQKITEYWVLLVLLLNQVFQDLQYGGSFLCVSLLLPTVNNSKIAVISGIYLTVIN